MVIKELRSELERAADPVKAPQMQAYMKSTMPYHGVPMPVLKTICRRVFKEVELPSAPVWQALVSRIWKEAEFREERYAALILAGDRRARPFQTPATMAMYEKLIVSGAWWDFVDDIATHRVGEILAGYPVPMKRKMLAWSKSANVWKRRTSILCQIGHKDATDLKLLYACIEPSLASGEFFLRKAIGWALRQVAWRDPDEVIRYVKKNRSRLSPLSKREALKNLLKSGRISQIP